jgi:hypothetical protein
MFLRWEIVIEKNKERNVLNCNILAINYSPSCGVDEFIFKRGAQIYMAVSFHDVKKK